MSKSIFIDNQEYITVNEFSSLADYTPQGIYKMIKNPLNPLNSLVKTIKGVKYLPKSSVSLVFLDVDEKNNLNSLNENLNDLNAKFETSKEKENTDNFAYISIEIIEMLKRELESKNKQIEELNNRLEETTQALQNAQELTRREQELNAKNILMLENSEQKKKGIFKRFFNKSGK